jgi:methyl-accepting chemotaxis protein
VEDAAQALSAECLRIAEGAQAQTLSTASIASAVEELDGAIHTLSSHTEHVVTQAHSAETLADQAQSQLDSAAARMGAMRDTLSQAHGDVGELADKTESIGQVVAVIQGIAEQTNLLALNAAIEAARAGETGRGFAVVADEVRKLAEHTARATQDIAGTISAIQQQTRQAAERLNHSQAGVDASVEEIAELHPAMEQLRAGAGKTRQAVEQLQSGLAEQASAAGLIGQQAERVAQTAEAFVHGVRRSTDTADSLLGVVGRLNGQLAQFRV